MPIAPTARVEHTSRRFIQDLAEIIVSPVLTGDFDIFPGAQHHHTWARKRRGKAKAS